MSTAEIRDHYIDGDHYRTQTKMLGENWQDVMIFRVYENGYIEHVGSYGCDQRHLKADKYDAYIAYKFCTRVMNQRLDDKKMREFVEWVA